MSHYVETAIDLLKTKGFRITKPRRLILELLDGSDTALSAYGIRDTLDGEQTHVDVVTVYRVLDCLEENQLIHRIMGSGKVLKCQLNHEESCEREEHHHCHHLMICNRCESIQEVHCQALENVIQTMETSTGFQVASHNLEFYGVCPTCQAA